MANDGSHLVTIRMPNTLHNKILQVAKKEGSLNKTEVIVGILEDFFIEIENSNDSLITEIDRIFSIENKIFMPKKVYKQIMSKTDVMIKKELTEGLIEIKSIHDLDYILLESTDNINTIATEQLLQKKNLSLLETRIEILEKK